MSSLFHHLLYRPIFNLLVELYNLLPGGDFGLAIVVLTVSLKIVFLPWSLKALRSQKQLTALQPAVKALQEKHKHDKTAQTQALMALYREKKVSPLSGCLPLLIQLPVLFALYQALFNGFKPEALEVLYDFVNRPEAINRLSFGFLDLAVRAPWLAVLAGGLQFWQARMSSGPKIPNSPGSPGLKTNQPLDFSAMNKQMLYFFPFLVIIIGWSLPAGLVLYWALSTFLSVLEQLYLKKTMNST